MLDLPLESLVGGPEAGSNNSEKNSLENIYIAVCVVSSFSFSPQFC